VFQPGRETGKLPVRHKELYENNDRRLFSYNSHAIVYMEKILLASHCFAIHTEMS
jgi:hypothetical protein